MPRVRGQRKTNKQIDTEYAAAKRNRVKKRPDLRVYPTPKELAEWREKQHIKKCWLKCLKKQEQHMMLKLKGKEKVDKDGKMHVKLKIKN